MEHYATCVLVLAITGACLAQNDTIVSYSPIVNNGWEVDEAIWEAGMEHYMANYSFGFELLSVRTDDNVTLGLYHIWNPEVTGKKIPVLLVHALNTNADSWFLNQPEDCFAMILAKQGYDVFALNFRGSCIAPLESSQLERTSIDYNIFYDLPANIDFVLNYTKQATLNLVSMSKGSYTTFALLASRPDYNEKVRLHVSLVPVTTIEDPVMVLRFLIRLLQVHVFVFGEVFMKPFDSNGYFDVFHKYRIPTVLHELGNRFPTGMRCVTNLLWSGSIDCSSKLNMDPKIIRKSFIRAFPDHWFSRELIQFSQNSHGKQFQTYSPSWVGRNSSSSGNFSDVKPFNMSQITTPHILIEAQRELFSQPKDYERIRNQLCTRIVTGDLSPSKYVFQINVSNYHHVDFLLSVNNSEYFGNALYMMMREHDLKLEPSSKSVLGFVQANFTHLSPQPCSSTTDEGKS